MAHYIINFTPSVLPKCLKLIKNIISKFKWSDLEFSKYIKRHSPFNVSEYMEELVAKFLSGF